MSPCELHAACDVCDLCAEYVVCDVSGQVGPHRRKFGPAGQMSMHVWEGCFVGRGLVFFPGQPSTINLSVLRVRIPRGVASMSPIDGVCCEFEGNTEEIWSSRSDVHAYLGCFVGRGSVFFPGQPSTINLSVLRVRIPRSVLSMMPIDGIFCEFLVLFMLHVMWLGGWSEAKTCPLACPGPSNPTFICF